MPSSVVQWMRYEPQRHSLLICFRGGRGTYRYFDVLPEAWERFRTAASKGTYLNTQFKEGGYGFERLGGTTSGGGSQASAYFWNGLDTDEG